MKWFRRLRAWFRREERSDWLLIYKEEGKDPVAISKLDGATYEEALDAAPAAVVNYQWSRGLLKDGPVSAHYTVIPCD